MYSPPGIPHFGPRYVPAPPRVFDIGRGGSVAQQQSASVEEVTKRRPPKKAGARMESLAGARKVAPVSRITTPSSSLPGGRGSHTGSRKPVASSSPTLGRRQKGGGSHAPAPSSSATATVKQTFADISSLEDSDGLVPISTTSKKVRLPGKSAGSLHRLSETSSSDSTSIPPGQKRSWARKKGKHPSWMVQHPEEPEGQPTDGQGVPRDESELSLIAYVSGGRGSTTLP